MPRATPYRTGLDCLNRPEGLTERQSPRNPGCSEAATGTTCHYAILSECDYYARYEDGRVEKVLVPCMGLKKDCHIGDTWTSRWLPTDEMPENDWHEDEPYLRGWWEDGSLIPSGQQPFLPFPNRPGNATVCKELIQGFKRITSPGTPLPNVDVLPVPHLYGLANIACACHWGPEQEDEDSIYYGLQYTPHASRKTLYRKWTMTVTSQTTATLDLLTRGGLTASYEATKFVADGETVFNLTAQDNGLKLPPCLGVISLKNQKDHMDDATGSFGEQCNEQPCGCCFDFAGASCPLPFAVSICDGPFVGVALTVVYPTTPLPCGVEYPSGAKCHAWIGEVSLGDNVCPGYAAVLLFLVWCDGTNWHVLPHCTTGSPDPTPCNDEDCDAVCEATQVSVSIPQHTNNVGLPCSGGSPVPGQFGPFEISNISKTGSCVFSGSDANGAAVLLNLCTRTIRVSIPAYLPDGETPHPGLELPDTPWISRCLVDSHYVMYGSLPSSDPPMPCDNVTMPGAMPTATGLQFDLEFS